MGMSSVPSLKTFLFKCLNKGKGWEENWMLLALEH